MKRSEALTLIQEPVEIGWGDDIEYETISNWAAHAILLRLEKAGMLPPENNPHEVFPDNCKWEPEDETR